MIGEVEALLDEAIDIHILSSSSTPAPWGAPAK
jgi:hypothetical protein